MSIVRLASCQIDVSLGDVKGNLEKILRFSSEAAGAGAKIIVFPEASLSGYGFESLDEAMPFAQAVDGPATKQVAEVCRDQDVHVIFGILEKDGDRIFNTALLVGPESLEYAYRKIHLPYIGIDRWTSLGDRPLKVVEARGVRLGINICYDLAFPETSRTLALLGADVIILPTNWPPQASIMPEKAAPTRAMENGVYYLASSRVGLERGCQFLGHSLICDPSGRFLTEADGISETILYAEIDPSRSRNKHVVRIAGESELHRFGDRRPEFYGEVVKPREEPRPHDLTR